jgi:hypothetical protein
VTFWINITGLVFHLFGKLYYSLLKAVSVYSFTSIFIGIKRNEKTMAYRTKCTQFYLVMELLIEIFLDGIAGAIGLLKNTAMVIEKSGWQLMQVGESALRRVSWVQMFKGIPGTRRHIPITYKLIL